MSTKKGTRKFISSSLFAQSLLRDGGFARSLVLYFAIALLITAPFWNQGYIFLTDMVWGPRDMISRVFERSAMSGSVTSFALAVIGSLVSHELLQKIVLFVVFALPGITMYTFMRRYVSQGVAVGAGLVYMINPFVYERLLIGHWLVLLGYGCFPVIALLVARFIDAPSWKRWVSVCFAFALYPLINLHSAYIASFVWLMLTIIVGTRMLMTGARVYSTDTDITDSQTTDMHALVADTGHDAHTHLRITFLSGIKASIILLAFTIVVNAFWLVHFFEPSQTFSNISSNDFKAFSTLYDPAVGPVFSALSLYGLWDDTHFIHKDFFDWWWVATCITLFFSAFGIASAFSRHAVAQTCQTIQIGNITPSRGVRSLSLFNLALCILFIPVLVLAIGYATPWSRMLTDFMIAHIPLYTGLRDTAKLLGLIAFAYAFWIALGSEYLLQRLNRSRSTQVAKVSLQKNSSNRSISNHIHSSTIAFTLWSPVRRIFRVIVLITPGIIAFVWAGSLLFGANGQIQPYSYPDSYYSANATLNHDLMLGQNTNTFQDAQSKHVLVLPWQAYPKLAFADNTIAANPAPVFFDAPTITSISTQNRLLQSSEITPYDELVKLLAQNETATTDTANIANSEHVQTQARIRKLLTQFHITHIIILKTDDWESFATLHDTVPSTVLYDAPEIQVLRLAR